MKQLIKPDVCCVSWVMSARLRGTVTWQLNTARACKVTAGVSLIINLAVKRTSAKDV